MIEHDADMPTVSINQDGTPGNLDNADAGPRCMQRYPGPACRPGRRKPARAGPITGPPLRASGANIAAALDTDTPVESGPGRCRLRRGLLSAPRRAIRPRCRSVSNHPAAAMCETASMTNSTRAGNSTIAHGFHFQRSMLQCKAKSLYRKQ
ncbi:hypothetical protein [Burkholderia glumae]|uniref:hypothetical protein n=1 Tax=Burkholderia glumae TaxID=337 RepID=UPI00146327A1|nr:hypothetical protein [Burkholderia glumae]QJP70634.1 hypothetical protein HJC54_10410 [Burkholderia glumae]